MTKYFIAFSRFIRKISEIATVVERNFSSILLDSVSGTTK